MSGPYANAIASDETRPALFVEINFVSGPVYVWTGIYSIVWNGHTWVGVGALGSISTIEEGSTVEAKGITVSLSGIQADLLTDILQEFQVGLPAIVYLGFFDDTLTLIPDPIISWAGRTDQPTIDVDGSTATISINCENQLVEMNVAVDRRYTNEDQQLDFPGDRGMEFVNSIQDARIFWGSAPSSKNNL
ncbi:MAG TPA: hypothetical protein VK638_17800 [Edaphobacter sp.]|nr:hypothetical protein [Edaphobacter sp.]